MEKISKEKNSRINSINNDYSQVSFLAQLELIKSNENDQLKTIALLEYYKLKYRLKECEIRISRIDEINSTTNTVKRKRTLRRDKNFIYF